MATGSFLLFTHQCGHCADHGNFSPYAMAKKLFLFKLRRFQSCLCQMKSEMELEFTTAAVSFFKAGVRFQTAG
jgi:hypothetical protein